MTTTTEPFDLLAEGIRQAIHGRDCVIPLGGGELRTTREHVGLVQGLTWDGLRSLDGVAITIQSWHGDPFDDDHGLEAHVLVGDRSFPVVIREHRAGGIWTRAGAITEVHPNLASLERWRKVQDKVIADYRGPDAAA